MVAALEGQFFWEPTTKYETSSVGFSAEIRRAQKKFVKKQPAMYKPQPLSDEKKERIKQNIEAQKSLPGNIKKVRDAILDYYKLTERELEGDAGKKRLFPARCHYIWSVFRYNPEATFKGLGRIIGRHHATIMHNNSLFEKNKHLFGENILAIDKKMEYV